MLRILTNMLTKIIMASLLLCSSALGAVGEASGGSWIEGLIRSSKPSAASGSDKLVIFRLVAEEDGGDFSATSVKLGTTDLTLHARRKAGTGSFNIINEVWLLKDADIPASDSIFTVVWSHAPSVPTGFSFASAVLNNVDQTTPVADEDSLIDHSNFTSGDITLTYTAGDYTTVDMLGSSSGRTMTWTNATKEFDYTISGASASLANDTRPSGSSVTITATFSSNVTRAVIYGLTIGASGEPPAGVPQIMRLQIID